MYNPDIMLDTFSESVYLILEQKIEVTNNFRFFPKWRISVFAECLVFVKMIAKLLSLAQ